jgi:hypothetical protein
VNRYALINDSRIDNVALVDDTTDEGLAYLSAISGEYDTVIPVQTGGPGQYVTPEGDPIPFPTLTSDRPSVPPDGTTAATITYTNQEPTAPAAATFTVNGASPQPAELDNGAASVEVASVTPGDTITVEAEGLTITVEVTE